MKIINFSSIKSLKISPHQCYEWVEEVIENKGNAVLPEKISMKPGIPGVFYNCMPCVLPNRKYAGIKVVNRYPQREPSLDSQILLYDLTTGENIALIDGNWITTMRTGAVAAHSIKLFAKKNFQTIGIIGLGNTARAALHILGAIYPESHFNIRLKKYKNQHDLFINAFKQYPQFHFENCNTYEEMIKNSEVVLSAVTVFENDICKDEYFPEGCLVVPIHTKGFTNCDLFFDKIFADDVNHVHGFKNFAKFKNFAEVAEVVNGNCQGRTSDQERILAYNIGISIHDIYFAGQIFEMLQNAPEISLDPPTDKFWI